MLDISIQAPRVTLSTPQELRISRSPLQAQGQIALLIPKGTGGGNPPTGGGDTTLTMQYQFDALGQENILFGTDFQTYAPFPDTPATFDFGGWIANIALGVAVAAACVLTAVFVPAVGIIGSAALIGAAMSTLAVTVTIAMEDMADGAVRSWTTAMGQTLLGTVAGAASGVAGYYTAPFGVATIGSFIKLGILSGVTMRVATGNAMEHMDFGEYTWHVLNPLNMITDGLLAGLCGGATNYFRLGTAFPSQSMVNAYNASQAALQSVQAARAASQADEAANGTKNSNPSVSEGGSNLGKMDLDDLPQNVKDAFRKYDDAGWHGNVSGQTQGTNAGRKWGNRDGQLPTVDADGNPITYREFDVNNYNGVSGDGERFIVGSDGSVWYTDSHYGQGESLNGIDDFVQIK